MGQVHNAWGRVDGGRQMERVVVEEWVCFLLHVP